MSSEADVVVLTALAEEATAFEEVTGSHDWRETTHRRYLGALIGGNRTVVWPINAMGNVSSAVATQQAIALWNPHTILLAGIAGGLNANRHWVIS